MKIVSIYFLALASTASAFTATSVPAFTRAVLSSVTESRPLTFLAAEPEDEEGEGLDLNLEEMFDMYVTPSPF